MDSPTVLLLVQLAIELWECPLSRPTTHTCRKCVMCMSAAMGNYVATLTDLLLVQLAIELCECPISHRTTHACHVLV